MIETLTEKILEETNLIDIIDLMNLKTEYLKLHQSNKEIFDSFRCAAAIQQGMLPQQRHFERLFTEYFVLYHPQHIISGDFYWIGVKEETVFFSVSDCTGHGIGGAMLSVLGISFLNYIVYGKKHDSLGSILEELDKKWIDGGGETKITAEIDKRLSTAEIGLKNSNRIEAILSNPKASKALDNSQFLRSLLETPKELGSVEKYVKSNLYQSLPKESQDLVSLIVKMRNDYYRQTSGQAVTGGEAARNFFAVVQPTDNTETLLRKIRGQKVDYTDALSNAVDDYKMPATRKARLKALVESGRAEKAPADEEKRPANVPKEAKIAGDGFYYAPDPNRPGKYIKY